MWRAFESPGPRDAWFTGGLRLPFAKAQGAYRDIRPDDLLVALLRGARNANPELWQGPYEDFLVGCAYPEGEQGYNIARMSALGAGLDCPGLTLNRLCGSSLEAVASAAARVRSGWNRALLVGGVESMSRIPRRGASFSPSEGIRSRAAQAYISMGETAEEVARRYPHLSRAAQEEFAARSHERADEAYRQGHYDSQLLPLDLARDESLRVPVKREKMASLAPAFDPAGVVTAATSSPMSDGASCGWVLSRAAAAQSGLSALRILDVAWSEVAPEVMGLGPIGSMTQLFQRHALHPRDIAAFEINEAFAVQVLAVVESLALEMDKVNAWGGALALGHPLGASGLRLMMTLHHRLEALGQPGALGMTSLCIGGGQGMALLCEYWPAASLAAA